MTTIPYDAILSSGMFKCLIGPDKAEFIIHSGLLASQSKVLDRLVYGQMKEALEGEVHWAEVDTDTFIRFSQFAYTGDYYEAKFQPRQGSESSAAASQTSTPPSPHPTQVPMYITEEPSIVFPTYVRSVSPVNSATRAPTPRSWSGRKRVEETALKEKKFFLWAKFKSLHADTGLEGPIPTNSSSDDTTELLLSHARVYVFAECYDIAPLSLLSLRKLRQTLEHFQMYDEAVFDVIQLINYCYENTIARDGVEDLRSLLCMFAACHLEKLWSNKEFQELVRTCGEFSQGLITQLLNRLD
ncbi:unnamed protein product [Clonostachys byssicola]|uniref:BTB domain-containing protein n=1 Tax=Clonostachys byssicola TaxID=160290 RepID=A0A9N9U6S0_9HYPO|nr:unnamed protein product [Clonostachys byssicola]